LRTLQIIEIYATFMGVGSGGQRGPWSPWFFILGTDIAEPNQGHPRPPPPEMKKGGPLANFPKHRYLFLRFFYEN